MKNINRPEGGNILNGHKSRNILSKIIFFLFLFPSFLQAEPYFRPDLSHRPRLAFDGRDLSHIRGTLERIEKKEAPWFLAYQSILGRAQRGKARFHEDWKWEEEEDSFRGLYGQETNNGYIAACKALVVWLYSQGLRPSWLPFPQIQGSVERWIQKEVATSVEILKKMYCHWPCYRGYGVINRGITAAGSLFFHCQAYDFLMALPSSLRPSEEDLKKIEKNLADLAGDFYAWFFLIDLSDNNHAIRVSSALGCAAITLNRLDLYQKDDPSSWKYNPSQWIKTSLQNLHPLGKKSDLAWQISSGAYAEGTSYYHYAADLYLPFFFSYTRFLSGKEIPLLNSDPVAQTTLWCLQLRLPDGRRPAVDNARLFQDITPAYFLSSLSSGARNKDEQALFLWDWKENGYPGMTGPHALFLLALYDPPSEVVQKASAMKSPPFSPTLFLAQEGTAILRSGWGKEDSHVLIVAEHGPVRERGSGHDSVDNGAYTFYGEKDHITLDPGYGGWPVVGKTNQAHHRSMVLVDGKGPTPPFRWMGVLPWKSWASDAFIWKGNRTRFDARSSSVEVRTEYEGAKIRRTILLVGKDLLLVEDQCESMDLEEGKFFQTQIHTNAGKAKKRPLQRDGKKINYLTNQKKIPVTVYVESTSPLKMWTTEEFDAMGESPQGHSAIRVETRERVTQTTFLSVIAVDVVKFPEVTSLSTSSPRAIAMEIHHSQKIWLVVSNPSGEKIRIKAGKSTPALETNSPFLVLRCLSKGTEIEMEIKD